MSHLDEIIVTPAAHVTSNGYHHRHHDSHHEDDDDDYEVDDDGERALLSPTVNGAPWHDKHIGGRVGIWVQTRSIVLETLPTLLFTTIGLMFTGELLDHISHWNAMQSISQLIMIIPVILNLKGNIEMNLSARLSTAANMGELDASAARNSFILGNLALLQVQAAVVSFVAAGVSFLLGLVLPTISPASQEGTPAAVRALAYRFVMNHERAPRPTLPLHDPTMRLGLKEFVMVASTAMSAACLSALLLGSFMCFLIVVCRKFGRDPDNIAPPVAACLGDLVTLTLLGIVSAILIHVISTPIPAIIIGFLVLSSVACAVVTRRNEHVRDLLTQGWVPLFGAMVITSGSGIVLDVFVSKYDGYALLAVAIGGLPGGAGSILVSRLSTALHAAASAAHHVLPSASTSAVSLPQKHAHHEPSIGLVMVTLFLVTIPVELVYLLILRALNWLHAPFVFSIFALVFLCIGVFISLFVARHVTKFLWDRGRDPDMYALPIHSALMDLSGQILLVSCFELASALGVHIRSRAAAVAAGLV
ncbi:hypothetical protein FA95DRAFT_1563902 [Auriscalpium vulgare]|uniref:Uncharacterized protein n=1 Tax=Auriscalpium vulgare TaxID=40419 RepID=A0ACB8RG13_9AGAM|nr:hypothetical protein FA95DRAFT_1563902 [Auriscalpium vulgare]